MLSTIITKKLLIVIPCLNEAETLEEVISKAQANNISSLIIDVLVVDDGSIDKTKEIAEKAGAKVISHGFNRGVGTAFQTALNYAVEQGYEIMVNIDGDGQFNPADIPKIVEPVLSGKADMSTASRFIDVNLIPEMPKVKLIGNHMMSWLISRLVKKRFADVSCGFRCYSREALLNLNLHGAFTYTQETFLDFAAKNLRIVEVPISVKYFKGRESRVAGNILQYAINTSKIIFRGYRDYFPLRFFGAISLTFGMLAVLMAMFFFGEYYMTGKFSGYLYVGFSSAFLAIFSLIFAVLAIVTDMLDRLRVNQERILYTLKKRLH